MTGAPPITATRTRIGRGILLALMVLAACADSGERIPEGLACSSSSECMDGLGCSFNHCVVPTANRLVLSARIIPPPPSGLLQQQIPVLALDDGPDRLVSLIAPSVLRGTVRPADNPLAANIEGEVEVRTEGDIEGLDFVFSAHSLEGLDVDGFGYTLALLPGRSYTGSFRPADKTLPRHLFRLDPSDLVGGRYDIVLPARSDYLEVKGRVIESDYTAVVGARVTVLSEGREVAAVTTSTLPRGDWDVLLPPGLTSFIVRVEPPDDGSLVFPAFSTDVLTYSSERFSVIVPDLPPGTEPLQTVIRVTERRKNADGGEDTLLPAAGRTVTINGVLAGGTLRRTGTTDDSGEVRFLALPGAYECLVASPPQARAQTWHGFVTLAEWEYGSGADAVEIELAPRVPFVGHVFDVFDQPVESGRLTLERRIDAKSGESLVIAPAPFETELGPGGVFSAVVDPGTYDVLVAPDPASGAPHTFETEVVVGAEGLRFDLGLPPPGLLHLTVADPGGRWLSGAQVELWIDDVTGTPRMLAVGSTGRDGFVDLIVPHVDDPTDRLVEWPGPNGSP